MKRLKHDKCDVSSFDNVQYLLSFFSNLHPFLPFAQLIPYKARGYFSFERSDFSRFQWEPCAASSLLRGQKYLIPFLDKSRKQARKSDLPIAKYKCSNCIPLDDESWPIEKCSL